MIPVGLIGYGYWGPNLARNVDENPHLQLFSICDISSDRLDLARVRYPLVHCTNDPAKIFEDESIDAVIIATPVSTHYDLASQVLKQRKHLLVEKPMTDSVDTAAKLVDQAATAGKVLMIDHTFIYSPAVQKLKEIVSSGILGDILYYDSVRINLGLFQHDINVIWDLAPHDIAIMNYTIGKRPKRVSAHGSGFVGNHLEHIAYVNLEFEDSFNAHFHVNWLAPVKIRQTLIGGSKKMVVYNENEPTEKIKIYDSGIEVLDQEGIYKTLIQYRTGDIFIPKLENREPLNTEIEHFVDCIQKGKKPWTDGHAGLEIIRILHAAQVSIKNNGIPIDLE